MVDFSRWHNTGTCEESEVLAGREMVVWNMMVQERFLEKVTSDLEGVCVTCILGGSFQEEAANSERSPPVMVEGQLEANYRSRNMSAGCRSCSRRRLENRKDTGSCRNWQAFSGVQQESNRSCFHGRDDPGCCVENGPDRSRAEAEIASESCIWQRNTGLLAFPSFFLTLCLFISVPLSESPHLSGRMFSDL